MLASRRRRLLASRHASVKRYAVCCRVAVVLRAPTCHLDANIEYAIAYYQEILRDTIVYYHDAIRFDGDRYHRMAQREARQQKRYLLHPPVPSAFHAECE